MEERRSLFEGCASAIRTYYKTQKSEAVLLFCYTASLIWLATLCGIDCVAALFQA
jgi:hypothetical protein